MFDRNVRIDASAPRTVEINHHRQSTADDARLYGELLDRARDEVLWSFPVTGNVLGNVTAYRDLMRQQVVLTFVLNGRNHKVEIDDMPALLQADEHARGVVLRRAISDEIARALQLTVAVAPEKP